MRLLFNMRHGFDLHQHRQSGAVLDFTKKRTSKLLFRQSNNLNKDHKRQPTTLNVGSF